MNEWVLFWKYLCGAGLLIYLVTLVIIIPLGARDIVRLFKALRQRSYANLKNQAAKNIDSPGNPEGEPPEQE